MQWKIVLTGGPSAGKTTLISALHARYGNAIAVAPEAANRLFETGHPRPSNFEEGIQTQRKIYSLQKDLEHRATLEAFPGAPLICDRGSLDGSAYWPGTLKEFCFAMGTSIEREVARYSAVIHLQTAAAGHGYKNTSIRTETPEEAAKLDARIGANWSVHPNYIFIPHADSFGPKMDLALMALDRYLPRIQASHAEIEQESHRPSLF